MVRWDDIPEGAILTELKPGSLYTYETKVIEGTVTNYDKLDNLYIDYDRYIVADDCTYTVYGDTAVVYISREENKKLEYLNTAIKKCLEKKIDEKEIVIVSCNIVIYKFSAKHMI